MYYSTQENNSISPIVFLTEISNQIRPLIVGNQKNKEIFTEHIEKVIQEAKKYKKYLFSQWTQAKKAGLTKYDKDKNKNEWTFWTAYTYDLKEWGASVYFPGKKTSLKIQFYIKGKPQPDPLLYLANRIRGDGGRAYKGLEVLDYQYILLAIIYDYQNRNEGAERIYFDSSKSNPLARRLYKAVEEILKKASTLQENTYDFNKDVRPIIETAMLKIKADLSQPQGKDGEKEINSQFLSIAKESIGKLIKMGEGHYIEFKGSLEYDIEKKERNKELNKECLKAIAGFLNADGGVLLIGVQNDGTITGIERDLQYVQRKNTDGFELKLRDLMKSRFEPNPLGKVKISFEKIEEARLCKIEVNPVNFDQIINFDNEVYVREGNTTVKLCGRKLTDWIQQRKKTDSVIHENHYERNQRTDSSSEMQLYGKGRIANHKTEQDSKEKKEVPLEPKPPEFLQKILWYRLHGRKYWKLILVAILLLLGASLFVLPQLNIISLISKIIKSIHF